MVFRLALSALLSLSSSSFACNKANDSSRIAVAGGSLTEILYFLGEEHRIVAVDTTSNYPEDAKRFPSVGYVRNLSTEGLLSLSPTLIIGEDDMGPPEVLEVLEQLEQTHIQIIHIPESHSVEGIIRKVRCVAQILAVSDIAESRIKSQILPIATELRAGTKRKAEPQKAVFLLRMQDGSPLAAGRSTSADGLLNILGLANAMSDFEGWKPISSEALSIAQPEYIFIPERGAKAAGGVTKLAQHPAIRLTPAGRHNNIFAMDGMSMLGFGPRTLETAMELSQKIQLPRSTQKAREAK